MAVRYESMRTRYNDSVHLLFMFWESLGILETSSCVHSRDDYCTDLLGTCYYGIFLPITVWSSHSRSSKHQECIAIYVSILYIGIVSIGHEVVTMVLFIVCVNVLLGHSRASKHSKRLSSKLSTGRIRHKFTISPSSSSSCLKTPQDYGGAPMLIWVTIRSSPTCSLNSSLPQYYNQEYNLTVASTSVVNDHGGQVLCIGLQGSHSLVVVSPLGCGKVFLLVCRYGPCSISVSWPWKQTKPFIHNKNQISLRITNPFKPYYLDPTQLNQMI